MKCTLKLSHRQSNIKIIGIGCGGNNIVNSLYANGINDVSLVACDSDASVLERSKADVKLQLGTDGLGTGGNPNVGRKTAEDKTADIRALLGDETDVAFVVSCLGGGCGTGAAPVVAREARQMGITTICVATLPLEFEGTRRFGQSLDGVREMAKNADGIYLLNNQYIFRQHRNSPINEAFAQADEMMCNFIRSTTESITKQKKAKREKIGLRGFLRKTFWHTT
jgi:cell division protein FtsZ